MLTLVLIIVTLLIPTLVQSQPLLDYEPVSDPLELPAGMNFGEVAGIAIAGDDHIFVAHRGPRALLEFDHQGRFVRAIGEGLFRLIHSVRIDAEGNIWVADLGAHLVLKFDRDGRVRMVLGKLGVAGEWAVEKLERDGMTGWADPATMAIFNQPTDIGFSPHGEIYVTDGYSSNARIIRFDRNGRFVAAWGNKGTASGEFNLPHAVVVDNGGLVYVADRENRRIQIFDDENRFIREWTHVGYPYGLFLTADQVLYMTDARAERVVKLNLEGDILGVLGEPGKASGQFGWAHGIIVDSRGAFYVTELLNWRVQKFVPR